MAASKDDKAAEFEKELQEARQKREVNKALREKLRDNPKLQDQVKQDMIEDLLRVYKHPENTSIVTPVSRAIYRDKLGSYPELLVTDFFGNHSEFLRAAGLSDTRTTALVKSKAAKLSSEQGIAKFAQENVLRYHGAYDFHKGSRKHIEGLVCSDLHSCHCDPFARDVFMKVVTLVSPDIIVVNGDGVDFPSISSHPKLPGHFHLNLQQEIDWLKTFFSDLRVRAPNATIYFLIGNHEYRLIRYLADTAPALASLRCLNFSELFGLAESQISLVCRSNFLAPSNKKRKEDLSENWVVIGDCYVATHGLATTAFACKAELSRFNMSGTSGHTHRPQMFYHNTMGTGSIHWMSTPMMAHQSDGRDFVKGPTAWNMGFGRFSILPNKKLVSQQIVQVHEDVCFFDGTVFTPTKAVQRARAKMMDIA